MKAVVLFIFLAAINCSQAREVEALFYDSQGHLLFSLKEGDFDVFRGPDYLALRISKKKVQYVTERDDRVVNGVCKIINQKGDTTSIKILDTERPERTEHCIYIWADDEGLKLFAGVMVIGNTTDDCKDDLDKVYKFIGIE